MITKLCGIYKILNIITRDYYLGSSCNIKVRWNEHRRKLRKNIHEKNTHFQNAWNKYGEQAFEFSIVLLCDIEHKLYLEDGFIKLLNPAYNIATDAKAPMQGRIVSEETRQKLSEVLTGRRFSEEHKRKLTEVRKTRPPASAETLALMRESRLGYVMPEEQKLKIGAALKGRTVSLEALANMREASKRRRGKPSGRLGCALTDEHKRKIGEANIGKHAPSVETGLKMREITTLQWAKKKENTE